MAKRISKAEKIIQQLNELKEDRKSVSVVGFIFDGDAEFHPLDNPRWQVSGQTYVIKYFMFQVLDDIAEKENTDLLILLANYLAEKKEQNGGEENDEV